MNTISGVYLITNKVNHKKYVGASKNIFDRWKRHTSTYLQAGSIEYNKTLYKAFRKYGIENFCFEILEITNDIYQKEKEWIAKLDSKNNGYNETYGGEWGSRKGHCSGTNNGRALLEEKDIIDIRTRYNQLERSKDVYKDYENRITHGAFLRIWRGDTYKNIMNEVYTEKNKIQHRKIDKAIRGEEQTRSKWNRQLVKEIRDRKNKGERPSKVYRDYSTIGSKSSFDDIWYNRNWRDKI